MTRAALAALTLVLGGCIGLTVTPAPEIRQPPIPKPFKVETPPGLEDTDRAGLKAAPSLGPNVYYHEPEDLWYRRAYRRWYQAFRWNGHWFILDEVPQVLVDIPIEKVALPELPVPPPRQPWPPPDEPEGEPEVIEPP